MTYLMFHVQICDKELVSIQGPFLFLINLMPTISSLSQSKFLVSSTGGARLYITLVLMLNMMKNVGIEILQT